MDLDDYLGVRERIADLVDDANAGTPLPTCPGWAVRDVVAHLAGLCEDWVEGRLSGYASDEWTAAQVARFATSSVDEILARWSIACDRFAQLEDDPAMGPPARWAFGDAVTHEADIRGALDRGRVPHDVVQTALKGNVARWRQVLGAAGVPTLLLRASDGRDWWLGTPDDPDATIARTTTYEIFRALTGRRSVAQVRQWDWSSDPAPYLEAGVPYPFRWASADLAD